MLKALKADVYERFLTAGDVKSMFPTTWRSIGAL